MRGLLPVAGHWVSVLTGLVPLALVIALSPLSVIPAVLVVHSPQPRPSSLAFLGGWLLGLAVVTAVFVAASGALGGLSTTSPAWASWLRVVLGSALIVFGVLRWLTRHRHTEMPGWMRAFASFTPARAGLAIGSGGHGAAGSWIYTAFFAMLAASTVAIPILAYVAAGDRLDDSLERLKDWMEKNHAGMVAAILVVIGLLLLYNGVHAM
ncbi:integral membrane protein [Mycobacterium tuberculosis]|nr:integral membrane protein [Mycobacterium tuberculosis]